ncbi:hypothetical protein AB4Y44_42965, partial [Paraburkholderia sp. BR10937]
KAPASYKPTNAQGGTPYVDPFADEKPLYSITSANLAQYAGKLVRYLQFPIWQAYDVPAPININEMAYDFVKQFWALGSVP